jgi:hypothetical protein
MYIKSIFSKYLPSSNSFLPMDLNNIDTKAKCRHLKKLTFKRTLQKVFVIVYKLEKQSFMWHVGILVPALWTFASNLLSVYSVQCVIGEGRGVWGSGPQTYKHLPQSHFTVQSLRWRPFALPSMSLIFLRFHPSCQCTVSTLPHSYTPILTSRPSLDTSSLYHLSFLLVRGR